MLIAIFLAKYWMTTKTCWKSWNRSKGTKRRY